jgi:hypothetical protein
MLIVGYVSERERPQGRMQSSFGPTFSRNNCEEANDQFSMCDWFRFRVLLFRHFLKGFSFDVRMTAWCENSAGSSFGFLQGSHVI